MSSQIALIFFNLLIAGVILCHLVLTTPVIFKTLAEEDASLFLRAIFPRYYLLIFFLSLPALSILYFQDSVLSWWLGFNLSVHALVGLIGIPITNAAKDRGWEKMFSFSHGVSVYCTIVIFALSVIQFFLLIDWILFCIKNWIFKPKFAKIVIAHLLGEKNGKELGMK